MSGVKGGKTGLVLHNNISGKKSQALVTIDDIKKTYLFGVKVRDKESGADMSDGAYQTAIDTAVSLLEHYLDISISPVKQFKEYKDYRANDYMDWGYMQLDNYPVEQINSLKLVYFRDDNGQVDESQSTTIPLSWLRLDPHSGIVRLVPNGKTPGNLQFGNSGYGPDIFRSQLVPHAWEINYDYGFCSGLIPVLLNQAIAMIASIIILVTAGHLILGAGIAGSSISLDGLSQSINTTQSAENSGFSSTIKDISDKLYGTTKDDPFAIMRMLNNYYKGYTGTIL